MAKKQTKRTRKFISQGGVKARLQKGTITNKGSLKRKHNHSKKNDGEDAALKRAKMMGSQYADEKQKKHDDADFLSQKNLGELDMDSFFETFGDDGDDRSDEEEVMSNKDEESSEDDQEEEASPGKKTPQKQKDQDSGSDEGSDSEADEDDILEAERRMKVEMKKLQRNDPDFHQFLKENEDSLLDYGDEEPSDDGSQEVEKKDESSSTTVLTGSMLNKLETGAFDSHGIKPLKKIVNAFKSACHLADEKDEKGTKDQQAYTIESSEIFDRLMVLSLSKCHDEFHYHLLKKDSVNEDDTEIDHDKPVNPKVLERAERWTILKPIIFTFFKSILHILSEAKEPDLVVFVLKALANYLPYLTPFPRLAESMLKTLAGLWSAPIDSSEDYQVVRLHAFLRIRQLALTQPFPFIEECLKKTYLAYAQRAKFTTGSSVTSALPTLTFMGNCLVELYSLDYHSSYQHAFIYIRQLALHLRTAMQKKTTDSVYCWQFLHCLKLWVAVISENCQSTMDDDGDVALSSNGEDQLLRSLIFPLSQVIMGTARLVPSTRYLPLRLHCVRLLQQLAASAEIFIPTTSILLDAFDLSELSQPPKKVHNSNIQPITLTLRLRADNPLRTMEEMEMCISEVFVLLNRELDLYQYSAGFPEFSTRVSQRLKKFSKEARHARWRAYAKGCLDVCQKYSSWAMNERINPNNSLMNDVSPKDIRQLEVLKPHSTPSMGQRHTQSLEKERRLEVASRPIQKKTTGSKKEGSEDENVEMKETKGKRKKQKKNKKKQASTELDDQAPQGAIMDQKDTVEDLDWSDEE
jgi:nucleolar complex protein 2